MNLLRNSYVTIFYLFWCCTYELVVYLSGYVHSASNICCMQYVTTSLNAHFTITRVINIVQSHRLVHISIAHDAITFNMLFMCVSTRAPSVCVVPDFLKSHPSILCGFKNACQEPKEHKNKSIQHYNTTAESSPMTAQKPHESEDAATSCWEYFACPIYM